MSVAEATAGEALKPDTLPSQHDDESHTSSAAPEATATTGSEDTTLSEPSAPQPRGQNNKRSRPASDTGDAERAVSNHNPVLGPDGYPISKNQLKKLRRQQAWEAAKDDRRAKRKEKRHEKQARKHTILAEKVEAAQKAGLDAEEARRQFLAQSARTEKKHNPVPVAIVIDCDFERYMHDNEIVSLSSQVVRSYSMNRTAKYQTHLFVSSFGGKMKERFDGVLAGTYKHWKHVSMVEGDFVEAAKLAKEAMEGEGAGEIIDVLKPVEKDEEIKEESVANPKPQMEDGVNRSIVYLTSDSPYRLERLEPNTSYVIGGIVDRNREKGLCYKRAVEKKVRTAKLPIGEYMAMQSRFVLTTNQVVEIMAKWLECGNWGEAFLHVIPQRKGGVLKLGQSAGSEAGPEDGQDVEEAREAAESEPQAGSDKASAEEAADDTTILPSAETSVQP